MYCLLKLLVCGRNILIINIIIALILKPYKNDTLKFLIKVVIAIIFFFILILLIKTFSSSEKFVEKKLSAPFLDVNTAWADTTLKYMTLDEKISQLIMYNANAIDSIKRDSVLLLLKSNKFGGIVFKTDSLKNQIGIVNEIQQVSKIPVFVASYNQKGISQFKDILDLPVLETVISVRDDSVKAKYFNMIANFNTYSGVNFNIVPSKIPESRDSFFVSEFIKEKTSFIKNSQNKNIFTCIKTSRFFKGDSLSLVFNRKLINAGLSGVFFDKASIADTGVYSIRKTIRDSLNFGGLIFSEISGKLDSDSILAQLEIGSELFTTANPEYIHGTIKYLVQSEKLDKKKLNTMVRRILLAKTWANLNNFKRINYDTAISKINSLKNRLIVRKIKKKSITIIKNKNIIPYKSLRSKRIQSIILGNEDLKVFTGTLKSYYTVSSKYIKPKTKNLEKTLKQYASRNNIIIAFNNYKPDSKEISIINKVLGHTKLVIVNFGDIKNAIKIDSAKTILQSYSNSEIEQKYSADVIFGGIGSEGRLTQTLSDSLKFGDVITSPKTRLSYITPEEVGADSKILLKIDSIAKFGIRSGAFPGCQIFVAKDGNIIYDKTFGYHTYSRRLRVKHNDIYDLASITKIAATTLAVMRMYDKGRIRLNDKLGRFFKDTKIDYSNIEPDTIINIDTLKISEIKNIKKLLKQQDTLHLNDTMLIAFDTIIVRLTPRNNIFKVKIKELLLHKSGISPALPILPYLLYKKQYYEEVAKNNNQVPVVKNDTLSDTIPVKKLTIKQGLQKRFDRFFTRKFIKDSAEVQIARNFYLQNRYFDTLWKNTKRLRVYSRKIYKYSDVNMILLQQAIDTLNRKSINKYLYRNIYSLMGLTNITYKARNNVNKNKIVPTERDKYWREQLLIGDVHDPSAALLGGISGNAGLFSNAKDLATIGQMWLNNGTYGGVRYISERTVRKFTGSQPDSHRGLGFDKPTKRTIIGKEAPRESYGHTGFTGTCIWVDPVNKLVYVFLSNRVHPRQKNWRINRYKIRQKIHSVVYKSIGK